MSNVPTGRRGSQSSNFHSPSPSLAIDSTTHDSQDISVTHISNKKRLKALKKFSGAVILSVDDNPINQRIITRFLQGTQFHVITANGGLEALDILLKEKISLILMDVMMPDLDGYETTRRIRMRYSKDELPVVFVTAKAAEDKGYQVGGNGFLFKPVNQSQLLKQIISLLKKSAKSTKLKYPTLPPPS